MVRASYQARRLRDIAAALGRRRAVAERERWPRERLERHQRERFEALVRDAAERSPFWRERLPRGRVRIEELPILTKAEMLDRFDDVVTDRQLRRDELLAHLERIDRDELYLGGYRAMTTSGSSGTKALFVYGREAWLGILGQFLRYTGWVGAEPRLPRLRIAAIGGGSPTHMTQRVSATVDIGMHRVRKLAVTLPIAELVEQLNAFRPQFLNTYPSLAAQLAGEQLAGRLNLDLEGMSTSSELLTPQIRQRLEAAFGVRPTDLYGTTEGLWGCECERRDGVHLFEDMCLVENVDGDGRPVPPGEPGSKLLVTNLYNHDQPLIRFELTDAVTLDPEPCPCGRTLRRLRAIAGRADDVIVLDGVAVQPLQFAILTADRGVREFQVVQRGERLVLRLAIDRGADDAPARVRGQLLERLRSLGVREPRVEVELVDALERSAAGKLQLVIADPSVATLADRD